MFSFVSQIKIISTRNTFVSLTRGLHITTSVEAARKGTREKARKKKVKVEVQKVGFIPHNLRKKDK